MTVDGISEQDLADRVGISRPHLRKILEGTEPRWKLTRKLLRAVNVPVTVLERIEEERHGPEEMREDLISLVTKELGLPGKSANAGALSQVQLPDAASWGTFYEFILRALQPFSSARTTWRPMELTSIRSALLALFEGLVELADADNDGDPTRTDVKRRLIATALESAFTGQRLSLDEKVTLSDARVSFPSIVVNSSTYLETHLAATKLLADPRPTSGRHFILGVTGLLPSLWFNTPPGNGTDVSDLFVGNERSEVTAYRKMVQEVVAEKSSELSVARLILAAKRHEDRFLQCGIYKAHEHIATQARLLIVEHETYGDELPRDQFHEGLNRLKTRFPDFRLPHTPAWHDPDKDRAYLLIDAGDWVEVGGEIPDERIDLGAGWSAVPFLSRFIKEMHSDPSHARIHRLESETTFGYVDGSKVSIDNYLEAVGPVFDVWLFGTLNDAENPSGGCKWLFGLAGEVYWTSDIARLRLLTNPTLVNYIGEFWYSIWNHRSELLKDVLPWEAVEESPNATA